VKDPFPVGSRGDAAPIRRPDRKLVISRVKGKARGVPARHIGRPEIDVTFGASDHEALIISRESGRDVRFIHSIRRAGFLPHGLPRPIDCAASQEADQRPVRQCVRQKNSGVGFGPFQKSDSKKLKLPNRPGISSAETRKARAETARRIGCKCGYPRKLLTKGKQ
jgi:hypothetical protein